MNIDYQAYLNEYRKLWNNRNLPSEHDTGNDAYKDVLLEAITRDLKDEATHPRVRKEPYIKFFYAIKRIEYSTLQSEIKLGLIELHLQLMEEIVDNKPSFKM